MAEKQTLVSLTQNFVKILSDANGADVELTTVEQILGTTKRRLYDVINVLSGIGLVERSGKSRVRWTAYQRAMTSDARFVHDLPDKEQELDRLIQAMVNDIQDLSKSDFFQKFAWIDSEDAKLLEPDPSVALYSLKGPASMSINLSDEEKNGDCERRTLLCKLDDPSEGKIQLNAIRPSPRNM